MVQVMSATEALAHLRGALGLTQTEMADRMGIGLRAYQDLEAGKSQVRKIHQQAARMVSLEVAVDTGNPMVAAPEVRKMALAMASAITGG